MEHKFLSVEQVAERFGINPTTVYRLVKSRVLPAIKIGSQWRFSQQALEEWVQTRMIVPPAPKSRLRRGKKP